MSSEVDQNLISVLIPATSAGEQIEAVSLAALSVFDRLGVTYELLFLVEEDRKVCLESALKLQRQFPDRIRVLRFGQRVGGSALLRAGVENSDGEIIFTLPDRFSVDLAGIEQLYDAIGEGMDMAFASRAQTGSRQLQSRVFNRLMSTASGSQYRDLASGTRVFRRRVAEETPLYGDFYRYLPVMADRLGFRVREIFVPVHPDADAPLIHSPRLYVWRAIDVLSIMFVTRFTRYPLRLFGGLGAAFASSGALALSVLVIQRAQGTPFANRPALVLAALLIGLGVQIFSIGLLGELILFFRARRIRDYRVSAVYETAPPPLAERTSPNVASEVLGRG